jgi:hypothetical protein
MKERKKEIKSQKEVEFCSGVLGWQVGAVVVMVVEGEKGG